MSKTVNLALEQVISSLTPPVDEAALYRQVFDYLQGQDFRTAYCLKVAYFRQRREQQKNPRPFQAYEGNIDWLRLLWRSITPDALYKIARGEFVRLPKLVQPDPEVMWERLTASIPKESLLKADDTNIDSFRVALCMQDTFQSIRAADWLPESLRAVKQTEELSEELSLPSFCAPEFNLTAQLAPGSRKQRTLVLSQHGEPVKVEAFVLEHLISEGFHGKHTENVFWWQMMALFYSDQIFAFKAARPAWDRNDLPSEIFSPRLWAMSYKSKLELRSRELLKIGDRSTLERVVTDGLRNPAVLSARWFLSSPFDKTDYLSAVEGLPSVQLIALLHYLAVNYPTVRNGLPDLFVVRGDKARFIEVKQLAETVSPEQRRWHAFLHENGMQIEIARLRGY